MIAAHGEGLPVALGSPARRIDHSRRRPHVDTADGAVTADGAIVTLPSALLSDETLSFIPPLPEKTAAAAGLPLGLADKLFLSLSDVDEFDKESRVFGRTDRRSRPISADGWRPSSKRRTKLRSPTSPWPSWSACSAAISPTE